MLLKHAPLNLVQLTLALSPGPFCKFRWPWSHVGRILANDQSYTGCRSPRSVSLCQHSDRRFLTKSISIILLGFSLQAYMRACTKINLCICRSRRKVLIYAAALATKGGPLHVCHQSWNNEAKNNRPWVQQHLYHQQQDEQLWAKKVRSFLATQTLIYPASTVQPNCRVCRPCMIIMREPTTFYLVTPCNVACVSEKRVRKKIRRMRDVRPEAILRLSSLCRDLASLGIIQLGNDQRYCVVHNTQYTVQCALQCTVCTKARLRYM